MIIPGVVASEVYQGIIPTVGVGNTLVDQDDNHFVTQSGFRIAYTPLGNPPFVQALLDENPTTLLGLSETSGDFIDTGTYGGDFTRVGSPEFTVSALNFFQCLDNSDGIDYLSVTENQPITDSVMQIIGASADYSVTFSFIIDAYSTAGWLDGTGEVLGTGAPLFGSRLARNAGLITGTALSVDSGILRLKSGSGVGDNTIYHVYATIPNFTFGQEYVCTIRRTDATGIVDMFIDGLNLSASYGSQSTAIFDTALTALPTANPANFTGSNPATFYLGNSAATGLSGHAVGSAPLNGCIGSFAVHDKTLANSEVVTIHTAFTGSLVVTLDSTIDTTDLSYSNFDLTATQQNSGGVGVAYSTFGQSTGSFVFQVVIDTPALSYSLGVVGQAYRDNVSRRSITLGSASTSPGIGFLVDGRYYNEGVLSGSGASPTYTTGEIVTFLVDIDNTEITIVRGNNEDSDTISTPWMSGDTIYAGLSIGNSPSSPTAVATFDVDDMVYAATLFPGVSGITP